MFNFTTQTIFNKPFVVAQTEANVTPQSNLIYGTVGSAESGIQKPFLRIGNLRFDSENIVSIEKKFPSEQALAHVTFDVSALDTAAPAQNAAFTTDKTVTARFAFYIGLQQTSIDPYYVNAMVYKGKPVYVEFPYTIGGWTDKEKAALKKAANFVLTQGEQIMTMSVSGTEVTFTCVNGYQIIREAYLQLFDPALVAIDCCNADGGFVNVVEATPVDLVYAPKDGENILEAVDTTPEDAEEGAVFIYPGAEAFADYAWMVHNLRLPTYANYNYWSITNKMGELPAPGGNYVQYTIKVCQDRENIGGMVVGQKTHSVTTHVLYVLNNLIDDLDTALQALVAGTDPAVKIKRTADNKLTAGEVAVEEAASEGGNGDN